MLAGLSTDVATARLAQVGPNELAVRGRHTPWRLLLGIAREPMLLLLAATTALYFAFGDHEEAAALGVSVLAVATLAYIQERRAERALDALRELSSPRARVQRDGAWRDVDARELVPGDVIVVGEGDRAPADALLREGSPLTVDESALTGESVPVVKVPDADARELPRPGDPGAAVFASTLVTSGTAVAEVVATGPRTSVGRIGAALEEIEPARAPLQQEVGRLVRRIAIAACVLSAGLVAVHLAARHALLESLLAGLTLAMALLPEELPLVLVVFLALGARRLVRDRVLVRRTAAIDALGAITALCVDKTGTLTVNRMAIRRIVTDDAYDVALDAAALPEAVHAAVEFGLLACPRQMTDPMDRAFATLAGRALGATEHVHPDWQWVREYPLSPGLLAVTHVWRDGAHRTVVATKGAPEAIVELCHLDADAAAAWRARAEAMAADGLRVIGVARAELDAAELPGDAHAYAFTLVGLVGFSDPLRDDTAATIATCRTAGIRVVMITGDHATTARAIGRAAGLRTDDVLTGPELDALGDDALADRLARVEVIARAAPAHKLRIIRALRSRGEVVGMTGDGVNDAPALRAADVGIAMGRGTDVAREAAALVLLDDSLAAIVAAIRTGRTIYGNLCKVARYLVAVHVPIAGIALVPALLGWPLLLAPIHVVVFELVIDPTSSVVFELEPPAADVMRRPPRGHGERLLDPRSIASAALLGIVGLVGPLVLVGVAAEAGLPVGQLRTLSFLSVIAANLALVFATRGRLAVREPNRGVRWLVPLVGAIAIAIVALPPLRSIFELASIGPLLLVTALAAGAMPVLAPAALGRALQWAPP